MHRPSGMLASADFKPGIGARERRPMASSLRSRAAPKPMQIKMREDHDGADAIVDPRVLFGVTRRYPDSCEADESRSAESRRRPDRSSAACRSSIDRARLIPVIAARAVLVVSTHDRRRSQWSARCIGDGCNAAAAACANHAVEAHERGNAAVAEIELVVKCLRVASDRSRPKSCRRTIRPHAVMRRLTDDRPFVPGRAASPAC